MNQRLILLKQMLEKMPGDSFTLFAIAKEYEGLGDIEKALEYYLKLRGMNPNYVGLYYHLGKLYENAGRHKEAVEAYRTGMEVAHSNGDTHAWSELNGAKLGLVDPDEDF